MILPLEVIAYDQALSLYHFQFLHIVEQYDVLPVLVLVDAFRLSVVQLETCFVTFLFRLANCQRLASSPYFVHEGALQRKLTMNERCNCNIKLRLLI